MNSLKVLVLEVAGVVAFFISLDQVNLFLQFVTVFCAAASASIGLYRLLRKK